MRTVHAIELTLTGMLIHNFGLKGRYENMRAEQTAREIVEFLNEEGNLEVPPREDHKKEENE